MIKAIKTYLYKTWYDYKDKSKIHTKQIIGALKTISPFPNVEMDKYIRIMYDRGFFSKY